MTSLKTHGVVVILKQQDKFLLLKDAREKMKDYWAPPHGRCQESDLTEEQSVTRETFEETNLIVKPIKKIWSTKADTKINTVSFWLADIISGDIKLNNESSEYGWFSITDALQLQLYPGTKQFFVLLNSQQTAF